MQWTKQLTLICRIIWHMISRTSLKHVNCPNIFSPNKKAFSENDLSSQLEKLPGNRGLSFTCPANINKSLYLELTVCEVFSSQAHIIMFDHMWQSRLLTKHDKWALFRQRHFMSMTICDWPRVHDTDRSDQRGFVTAGPNHCVLVARPSKWARWRVQLAQTQ